jgi:hypothetical protein
MCEGVYSAMVKAGVAVDTPESRMYNKHGERVLDEYFMDGRPTKYQLIKPEDVIFVDETRFITKKNTARHIGGELLVFPARASNSCVKESCPDINFTGLCFNFFCHMSRHYVCHHFKVNEGHQSTSSQHTFGDRQDN